MAEQGLDVHQLGPSVEQVGGVSMPQLVRRLLMEGNMNTNLTMQKAIALLAYIAVLALLFPTPLAVFASTIAVEEPGNTVIEDGVSDFQLRNCDPSSPDRHCSLPPDALLTSPPFTDIIKAHITYAGGGLVELSMTFDKPISRYVLDRLQGSSSASNRARASVQPRPPHTVLCKRLRHEHSQITGSRWRASGFNCLRTRL